MNILDVIEKKRDGKELTKDEMTQPHCVIIKIR